MQQALQCESALVQLREMVSDVNVIITGLSEAMETVQSILSTKSSHKAKRNKSVHNTNKDELVLKRKRARRELEDLIRTVVNFILCFWLIYIFFKLVFNYCIDQMERKEGPTERLERARRECREIKEDIRKVIVFWLSY